MDAKKIATGAIGVVALFYSVRAALFFLGVDAALHFDEGYIATFGERMLDGRFLPYVDAVSQRGPVLYWFTSIAQWVGGRFEWTGIRHLAFLCFVLASLGVLLAGVAARQAFVGAVASLLFVVTMVGMLEEETVFAVLGEPVAAPFAVLSMAATGFALCRSENPMRRFAWLALAGLLAAVAGLIKQTYLPTLGPHLIWALLHAAAQAPGRRVRMGLANGSALLLGWLGLGLAVVLIYWIAGELDAFWYWFYEFNREVYMAPFDRSRALRTLYEWVRGHGLLTLGLVATVGYAVVRIVVRTRGDRHGRWARLFRTSFLLVITLQLLIALAGSIAPLRPWSQYYLPPVPWIALLLGYFLAELLDSRARILGYAITAIVLCSVCGAFLEAELHGWRKAREAGRWADARPEPACGAIAEYTQEGEPIFIWGFDSDLYITCRRRSASRYLYSTMVAGVVVPFWRDPRPEWVARNAQENLISELEQHEVALILDSPDRARGSSILHVLKLKKFVVGRYAKAGTIRTKDGRKMTRWVRKDILRQSTPVDH